MNSSHYRNEIDEFEAHYQYDSTYMRELLASSPDAYSKFAQFMPLASHREVLDPTAYWIAKLATMQVEDCGACLQLNVRMALEDNVAQSTIKSVLSAGEGLPGHLAYLYEFATRVAAHELIDSELNDHINWLYDKRELLELALCMATAKVFPTIKRTLGYAKQCRLVDIEL